MEMEIKIQKEFIDNGFGFPIRLLNVPMVKIRGKWTPKLNYNDLTRAVLHSLSSKRSRLTGNEIKFIRTHFEMTLQSFSDRFCVSHVAVIKWEKTQNLPTAMSWSTEKDIRMFILSKQGAKPDKLVELYTDLENPAQDKPVRLHLNIEDLAA